MGVCLPIVSTRICKGEGETHGNVDMVVVYGRVRGALCCGYIWLEFFILPCVLCPLGAQLIHLSSQLNQGFGYVRWIGTAAGRKAEA